MSETVTLTAYSALVPALPLADAAARFGAEHGVRIEVKPGRPEKWLPALKAGAPADLMSCGAEFLLDLAEADGLVEPGTRVGVGHRKAALIVPKGNPAGISGLTDFARPGLRMGISVEGCSLGLWDEVASRAGLREQVRSKITRRAGGCGALLGLVSRAEVDAAIGWSNFDQVPNFEVEVVPLPSELMVFRSTGVGVVKGSANRAVAERFVSWLVSASGRDIYRRWGWEVA